jgi:undecaprenyl-diphosphatase
VRTFFLVLFTLLLVPVLRADDAPSVPPAPSSSPEVSPSPPPPPDGSLPPLSFGVPGSPQLPGAEQSPFGTPQTVRAADYLGYPAAAILGVVEGVTEYLPVSSTGHLIIANAVLGLDDVKPALGKEEQWLYTKDKDPLPVRVWKRLKGLPVKPDAEVPFTLKNAADAYIIVIQFGAILAVLFAYWKRVSWLLLGLLSRRADSFRLARNLIVAFLPAAVLGFVFHSLIEDVLFGVAPVVFALFVGALVMLWVDNWHRGKVRAAVISRQATAADAARQEAAVAADSGDKKAAPSKANVLPAGPDLHELSTGKALAIGFAQCLALWPGTSRSMATICGGYLVGLSPMRATEFSFLLGLITLTVASVYKTISSGKNVIAAFDIGPLALGLVLATITAFFAVKWMVGWINRRGLAIFAWYRIAFAFILTLLFLV